MLAAGIAETYTLSPYSIAFASQEVLHLARVGSIEAAGSWANEY